MTGGVVEAVAAAIREHRVQYLDQWICGRCQRTFADIKEADAHVAAAVVEALALTPEFAHMGQPDPDEDPQLDEWSCGHEIITPEKNYGVVHEGYDEPVQRVVSPWVSVVRGTTQ